MAAVKRTLRWINARPLRFYGVALIFASLPLGMFMLAAHKILVHQVTGRLVAQSSQTGKLIGGILELHLQESSAALQSYAERHDLLRDAARGNWEKLTPHLIQAHMLRRDFSSLAIYDRNGALRSTHPPNLNKLGSRAKGKWLNMLSASGAKPYVSGAFQSELKKNDWVIALVVPLRNPRGQVVGYLVGEQTLHDVTQKVYGLTRESGSTLISFIDQEGQTFARFNKEVKVYPAPHEVMEHIRKPAAGSGTIIKVGGKEHLVAYSPINSLGWGTYIQVPMSALQPALWVYEKNIALASLFILAIILGGSGYVASLYRQIARQSLEIERASELKSKFMASMSHEIRTPLNAILGFAGLMEESLLESKQQRWAGHIRKAGLHLLQLVNDVLDLSKIEAGQLELHWEPFSLEGAIPEVTSVLAPIAAQKKIEPAILVEDGLLVYADRIRFKQILYNLMSNAIKFTPEGGRVEVKAVASGHNVELTVSDSGVGIDEYDHHLIFEEFEQVGESATTGEGVGLGLAITKKIVEQHGGSISVKSRKGEGSLFRLTLPRPPMARPFSAAS